MSVPSSKWWIRLGFACLAVVAVIAVFWWVRVNREEIPPPIVIGRDVSKPKRLPRFSDIVTSTVAESIRVDYAFLSVVRPPLKRVLPPGVSEAEADRSMQYSWDDPVFDEIQGRLSKIEEGDEAAWKRSINSFQGTFHGVNLEVVAVGSSGNSYHGGPFVKPLHIKVLPKAGDPVKAGYEGDFLLAQAREGRLVGFRKASPTCVAYGVQDLWMPMDIANKEMQITKFFETMTTYNIVVLRFSAVGKSDGSSMSFMSNGGYRGKPIEDKAALIKLMIEGQKQIEATAKQRSPERALPKLQ